jgi:DNA-binding IclR family transcriptional regulator
VTRTRDDTTPGRETTAPGSDAAAPPPRNGSSSLRRALAVLDHLAEATPDPRGATLAELADGLAIPKSTLVRLLAPLRDAGLVERDGETGRHRLGARNARLGQLYLERLDLRGVARDVLHRLVAECGETVHLVVPGGSDPVTGPCVVYVDKVESSHAVRMHSQVGMRQPVYCTGVGKAWLAFAPEETVAAVVDAGMPRRTPATLTSEDAVRAALEDTRRRGYAVDDVENEPDIRCVAAPVFDHGGTPVAALSVSGPTTRVTASRVEALGGLVRTAAAELSARLGARTGART